MNAKFWYDEGKGFVDKQILEGCVSEENGTWYVDLQFEPYFRPQSLLWMPFADAYTIKIKEITGAKIIGHNAHLAENEQYTFVLGDLFFYLQPIENAEGIKIVCEATALSVPEQRELLRADRASYDALKAELESLQRDNERLKMDLESVTNSTIWRKTEVLRNWKDRKKVEPVVVEEQESIIRKYDENTPVCDLIYDSVDSVKIVKDILTIEGWVLCINHAIKDAVLLLEDEYGIRRTYDLELKGRRDVSKTLNIAFTGDCGFVFCAEYKSYSSQRVFLKVLIGEEWYEVDTRCTIPPCKDVDGGAFFVTQYCEGEPPLDYLSFCEKNIADAQNESEKYDGWSADVIVPVYNGMKYLPKLFGGIEKTTVDYRLIIVDDCSPDPEVREYLEEYASLHENVTLLCNETNMGFVKSVNRALQEAKSHVVLVNTDVELPANWLERMLAPMYANPQIASVTPFTNSGTIFSFPDFAKDNVLFANLDVDEIDATFAKVKPRHIETPTGVGFCMAMSRKALDAVGLLDDITFEKGYGEENDWCQRAIKAGFHNVYAENLFVYHNHGGSFDSETKKRLLRENGAKLQKKHPQYQVDVESFLRRDPNQDIRSFVKFELLYKNVAPMLLVFNHDLGGGATSYLDEKVSLELAQEKMVGVVYYNAVSDRYRFHLMYGDYSVQITIKDREALVDILKRRYYEQIWINELATYRDLQVWLEDIAELRKANASCLRMLVHDYFAVCPSLNLVDPECKYCGIPQEKSICENCLMNSEYIYNEECKDIDVWRSEWGKFLEQCDEVVVFSEDCEKRIREIYPRIPNILLIPHTVTPLPVVQKKKSTNTVNIGILGAISGQKGLWLIRKILAYLEEHDIGMHIFIIGIVAEEISSPMLTIHGSYTKDEIPALTAQYDIDAFFISSVWPETFSYTTSEVMSMEMPLAVFDMGAPAERVKDYEKGMLIESVDIEIPVLVKKLYDFAKEGADICRQ